MKHVFAASLLALLSTAAMAQQTGQSQQTVRPSAGGFNAGISNGSSPTSRNSGTMTSSGPRDSTTGVSGSQRDSDINALPVPKSPDQKDRSKGDPSKSKEPPANEK
jgi:hypothetical protein